MQHDPETSVAGFALPGGGKMGELIRSTDWDPTPLGPLSSWSPTLRMMVRFLLANRFPMLLWWGPRFCQFYNDAYRPILGNKHPNSMGQPGPECWAEIWDILEPLVVTPYGGGPPTWMDDLALEINRHGFFEETHFTIAYSAVPDDWAPGGIGGVLATVNEITEKVVGERRIRALRDLGARALEAKSALGACEAAAETIVKYPKDLPFVLIYLTEPDGRSARLVCAAGTDEGGPASPRLIPLAEGASSAAPWPLAEVMRSGEPRVIDDLRVRLGGAVPGGPWSDPPSEAVVAPIHSTMGHNPAGFLVAGISSRLRFDETYRSFIELATGQIATALANARAYEQERQRAEALAEIDRAKTAFLSNVSHEFRTPLTLMLGPIEESLESEGLPPEDRERMELVHRNGLRLLKLVNTLLDFSRIEAGRAQATYRPADLPSLTADLGSTFRSAIEAAGLELTIDCPAAGEPAWIDPEMWEKIVLNLVSNAFKFTLEGRIEVALHIVRDHWRLSVRDTGIGIDEKELPRVFERFHRVEGVRGRSYEGSGIGLALVQELVRLHGGTVVAESAPGRGTAFVVSIPRGNGHLPADRIAGPAAADPARAPVARAFVEEALRWLPEPTAPERSSATADVRGHAPSTAPLRILLADDNADLRDYVRTLLAPHYEVECVADGEAALEAARRRPPDLVLSDVMMPKLSGIELLQALRADPHTRSIPVVLLSARAGEESRVEGLELGADDYLVKPFSARELLARVGARISESTRQAAESRLHSVLDVIPDGFSTLDADGRYTYVNRALRRLWDRHGIRQDVIGRHVFEIFPEARETAFGRGLERARAERRPVEVEAFHEPFGRWFLARFFPTSDGGLSTVSQDITARRLAEEQVRDGERRKDEFLATLAHEMRNPLAPIRNAIAFLNAREAPHPDEHWARGVIERQVAHLARLLDDLLDVSRIAKNRLELKRERFTLASVVQRSLEASQPVIDRAGQALAVQVPEEDLWLDADPLRISQVLSNLLNNAAKYTPRGGQIVLLGCADGADVVISVRDTGIGMAHDLLPRVFDMFVQAAPAQEQSEGGLGIGLSLVRGIVEAHGGRVQAKSGGPGLGSEFIVRLPAAVSSGSDKEPADPRSGAASLHPAEATAPMKLLVADDNADSADSLAHVLLLEGHEVHVARDGEQALEIAARICPDAAVLDIGMPRLTGYEVARRIREQVWGRGMVLAALTGWGQQQDRERALGAGFDLHLVKPVEAATLASLLWRARTERGAEEEVV